MAILKVELEFEGTDEEAAKAQAAISKTISREVLPLMRIKSTLINQIVPDAQIQAEEREQLLKRPLEALGLTSRPHNMLTRVGVETVSDLVAQSRVQLMNIPDFGRKSLEEVEEALAAKGLSLQ
jgi:DNA-directed RNA polymerase subunit alpha